MKKILIALLLVLSCVLLFACVQDDPATDTTAPSDGATDAPTEAPTDTPTEAPTEAPTDEATDEPTEEATTEEVTEPEPSPVVLYQLVPEKNSLMQSYVIKTQNGKLIVIDGGIDGEGRDRDPYMPAALRAIMGVNRKARALIHQENMLVFIDDTELGNCHR